MINTNNNAVKEKRPFGMRDKIGYFFGDLGAEGFFDVAGAFLMVYYTDVFGINPVLTGTIFLFARLWDAFMDVMAGRFIDKRPNSPEGRFRPWIIKFAPVLMLSGIIMYIKIPGFSNTGYLIYATITYVLWGTCHSFATIPYGSMTSVITDKSNERASLSAARSSASNIAQMVTKSLIPLVAFSANKPDAGKFLMVAIIVGIFGMTSYTIFYKLTTERIIVHKPKQRASILLALKDLIKNKGFVAFICSGFLLLITSFITNSLNTYLFKDYFQDTRAMAFSGVILILNVIVLAPTVPSIVKKFGKKESVSVALLFSAIGYVLLYLIPIKNGYVFVGANWIANLGVQFFMFVTWACLADIIDDHELKTGRREDGTVLSIYTFTRKVGQSAAGFVSGVALSLAGYVKAPQQTPEVAMNIRNIATLAPAILYVLTFVCIAVFYPMTKAKVEEIRVELAEKRAERAKLVEQEK